MIFLFGKMKMASQKMSMSKSLEPVDDTLYRNSVFIGVIKLRILRWEIILDYQSDS